MHPTRSMPPSQSTRRSQHLLEMAVLLLDLLEPRPLSLLLVLQQRRPLVRPLRPRHRLPPPPPPPVASPRPLRLRVLIQQENPSLH